MSLEAVERGLGEGRLTWVVLGDVPLFVERAVNRVVAWGRERCGPPQFNLSMCRATDPHAISALATARTLPMMAAMRVVVIRDVEMKNEALWQAILAYLADPSPSTLLVLCGSGFPKTERGSTNWSARVTEAVKNKGCIVRFSAIDISPVGFARDHAKSFGKDLGSSEANLLIEIVGRDIGVLAQEIEKVAVFVGENPRISSADIHSTCSLLAEPLVWDLTNGIASKNPALAVESLYRALEGSEATRALLGRIAWQIRQILLIGEMLHEGRSENEIRAALNTRGEAVSRTRRFLSSGATEPAVLLSRLARANRMMNSARAGDRHTLEALVLELCN